MIGITPKEFMNKEFSDLSIKKKKKKMETHLNKTKGSKAAL